jgi:hypothetical protein
MRWNCPHCGIALAVSDEKLGAGWSFSRCYKCAGFSLVRRSDINLIKVDRAPMSEKILLPEASEDPIPMMNKEATAHLANNKPEIRPANRKQASKISYPPRFISRVEARGVSVPFPNPLPELSRTKSKTRLLPIAIGIAGVIAVGSGVYLYIQGQQLWQKARATLATQSKNKMASTVNDTTPVAQAPSLLALAEIKTSQVSPPQRTKSTTITDELHQNAMAPARTASLMIEEVKAHELASSNNPNNPAISNLVVQTRLKKASLRSGPGLEYPVLGVANPQLKYIVSDWKDRWFKVTIDGPTAIQMVEPKPIPKHAWIRNDLVQLISGSGTKIENADL